MLRKLRRLNRVLCCGGKREGRETERLRAVVGYIAHESTRKWNGVLTRLGLKLEKVN